MASHAVASNNVAKEVAAKPCGRFRTPYALTRGGSRRTTGGEAAGGNENRAYWRDAARFATCLYDGCGDGAGLYSRRGRRKVHGQSKQAEALLSAQSAGAELTGDCRTTVQRVCCKPCNVLQTMKRVANCATRALQTVQLSAAQHSMSRRGRGRRRGPARPGCTAHRWGGRGRRRGSAPARSTPCWARCR